MGQKDSKNQSKSKPISSNNVDVRFLSINVCGLLNRSIIGEIDQLINEHDIIAFTETKTDDVDAGILIDKYEKDGFLCKFKNRFSFTRKSGGISILVRKKYKEYCTFKETGCKYVQWVTVKAELLHTENDVLIGAVYIPSEGSPFVNNECFNDICEDIINLGEDKLIFVRRL